MAATCAQSDNALNHYRTATCIDGKLRFSWAEIVVLRIGKFVELNVAFTSAAFREPERSCGAYLGPGARRARGICNFVAQTAMQFFQFLIAIYEALLTWPPWQLLHCREFNRLEDHDMLQVAAWASSMARKVYVRIVPGHPEMTHAQHGLDIRKYHR